MIGPKLHFEAIGSPGVRHGHDAGVIDQEFDGLATKRSGKGPHGIEAGQVQRFQLQRGLRQLGAQLLERLFGLFGVATGQDDMGASRCQRTCGEVAQAAVGTRNHGGLAGQVGHVGFHPLGHDG